MFSPGGGHSAARGSLVSGSTWRNEATPAQRYRAAHAAAHLDLWMEQQATSGRRAYRGRPRVVCAPPVQLSMFRCKIDVAQGRDGWCSPLPRVSARPWSGRARTSRRKAPCSLPLIQRFTHWMHEHRGTRAKTLDQYGRVLDDLAPHGGEDPTQFHAAALRRFVLERGQRHSRGAGPKHPPLRCGSSCATWLPQASARRHSRCHPPGGPVAAVDLAAISSPRRTSSGSWPRARLETPVGLRDRAILLLLCRLGLRAQEVVNIRLGDIDWQDASLIVSGKGGRRDRLPLTQEVGDAILAYLEHGRPPFDGDSLFLRARAPQRSFTGSTALSTLARRAIRRAQVKAPTVALTCFATLRRRRCFARGAPWKRSPRSCVTAVSIPRHSTPRSIWRSSERSPSPGRR